MRLNRKLRERLFYKVPEAGGHVFYSRAESYRAADEGLIPTEMHGRFRLVPRKPWDLIRKKILAGQLPAARKTEAPKRQREAGDTKTIGP